MGLIPVLGSVRICTGYMNLVTIISRYTHVPITLKCCVFSFKQFTYKISK